MIPHDLQSVAFPRLDESQIASLSRCAAATRERYEAGRKLFQVGDRAYRFFVIQSGQVEIVDESGDAPRTIAIHGPGEFTGEMGQLTGRPAVASAVARTDCDVYAVTTEALRQILNQCPDLGDIILQAFIARRQLLRESGDFTGVRVIGSRYSKDTHRIRDFLARNRVLFTFLDLESDPDVSQLTGPFLSRSSRWTARRQPFLLETSRPGVFAAGDVRSGSVKRVASAVGEGAMAVQFVHAYLREM